MGMQKGHKVGSNSRIALRHKEGKSGYAPTDKDRQTVFNLCGYGMPHIEIASYLGITAATLQRHFQKQLDKAKIYKNRKVARRLYLDALISGNIKAQMFFLGTQAHWRSNTEVPIPPLPPASMDYSKLTVEELKNLRDLLGKAESKTIDITPGKVMLSGKA